MNTTEVFFLPVAHEVRPEYYYWKMIPDTPEERQKAIDEGYTCGSLIPQTFDVIKGKWELISGPLFINFEVRHDPAIAVSIARKLISDKLVNCCGIDPGCLRYWLNCSKGCHIEIPMAIYGTEKRPFKYPPVEHDMLKQLRLDEFYDSELYREPDPAKAYFKQVFLIEWPNVKQLDGRYKVPVSAKEFFSLDYPDLERLTFSPRTDFEPGTKEPVLSPFLAKIYDIAVSRKPTGFNSVSGTLS